MPDTEDIRIHQAGAENCNVLRNCEPACSFGQVSARKGGGTGPKPDRTIGRIFLPNGARSIRIPHLRPAARRSSGRRFRPRLLWLCMANELSWPPCNQLVEMHSRVHPAP